eukprot:4648573-Prymnesium_polylepis.1
MNPINVLCGGRRRAMSRRVSHAVSRGVVHDHVSAVAVDQLTSTRQHVRPGLWLGWGWHAFHTGHCAHLKRQWRAGE